MSSGSDPARERRRDAFDRLRESAPRVPGSDYHLRQLDKQAGHSRKIGEPLTTEPESVDALLARVVARVPAAIAADDEAAARWLGMPTERYVAIREQLWREHIEQMRRKRREILARQGPPDTPPSEPVAESTLKSAPTHYVKPGRADVDASARAV